MTEYVRVRDKETGHHYSLPRERYDQSPDLWQALKQPATDAGGDPLPPKYHTSVSQEAEKKAESGQQKAQSTKETH